MSCTDEVFGKSNAYVRFCCIHPHPGELNVPASNRGPFVASSRARAQPYPRGAKTGVMRSNGRSAGPTCRAPSRPGVDQETA